MTKILIVDDEERIRSIYRDLLVSEGYDIIEATDANNANDRLLKEDVDLVLLDIKMPNIDGGIMHDVIKMFHRKCKVIISSVYPLDEQRQIISGAEDYHDKSQGAEALLVKIKEVLKDTMSGKKGGFHVWRACL